MGADLYLNSVYYAHRAQYESLFDEWVERRNALQKAGHTEQAEAAQLKVEEYYDKLYERGYFRDSYNSSNLLWLFGLSWWADIPELLDECGTMSPDDAQTFLHMLSEQEATFEANLKKQTVWEDWTKAQMEQYFREKYKNLKSFLEEAITLNEAIECSI